MINVMYATDENYAEIMCVSILSLLESNMDSKFHFYLVLDSVTDESSEKIRAMILDKGSEVTFIPKPDIRGMLGVSLNTLRWSDSAYSRLFLKELFGDPPVIDKLLYIDCDTIITDSLRSLWETDISDYLGAGCWECMSNMHKRIVGADKRSNYINTGMLLINVRRWVEEDIQDLVSEFIQKYKGNTEYVDQGVINGTVSNRFRIVDPRYNMTALGYDFSYEEMRIYRKPQFGYSKEVWERAVENPAVVHFTTSFLSIRPWFYGSMHPYAAKWKEVHDRTPWKNQGYRELKDRDAKEKKIQMYRSMPKGLAVRAAGFLHAYVKPIMYVIRNK